MIERVLRKRVILASTQVLGRSSTTYVELWTVLTVVGVAVLLAVLGRRARSR